MAVPDDPLGRGQLAVAGAVPRRGRRRRAPPLLFSAHGGSPRCPEGRRRRGLPHRKSIAVPPGGLADGCSVACDYRATRAAADALPTFCKGGFSHDLRTPLTSISGDADMLLASGDVLDEAQRKRLTSDIHEDANWLINLVENLLSVTRLDDGDVEVSRAPELVSDVLADAVRHVSRFVSEHRLTVEIEDEFLLAQMDGRLIVQVVVNLLNNAIAYTPAGSSIRLTAHRERSASGDRVVVAVADDGPGIPPAEQARVFDLFYHGGRVGTGCEDGEGGDARRGMGLGLSLCRSILRAHGSDIVLRDAYPHGCVFSFALPAAELREEAPVGVVEEGSADVER
ncbi:MAG: sensor histidine kinase [Adlercreutzia equolifaciens]